MLTLVWAVRLAFIKLFNELDDLGFVAISEEKKLHVLLIDLNVGFHAWGKLRRSLLTALISPKVATGAFKCFFFCCCY